jgi:hypothetical protein
MSCMRPSPSCGWSPIAVWRRKQPGQIFARRCDARLAQNHYLEGMAGEVDHDAEIDAWMGDLPSLGLDNMATLWWDV